MAEVVISPLAKADMPDAANYIGTQLHLYRFLVCGNYDIRQAAQSVRARVTLV